MHMLLYMFLIILKIFAHSTKPSENFLMGTSHSTEVKGVSGILLTGLDG